MGDTQELRDKWSIAPLSPPPPYPSSAQPLPEAQSPPHTPPSQPPTPPSDEPITGVKRRKIGKF